MIKNIIIVVLLLIIAAGAYKFIIKGNVVVNDAEQRTSILLEAGEKNFILGEMRALLSKVQRLIGFLANDDMQDFTALAKVLKEESAGEKQQALISKMPLAFKLMSNKIHSDFGQLYDDAVTKNDKQHSLKQVSDMMTNCVACHSTFHLATKDELK